jgi:PAS domain S-box-containing protein
VVVADEGGIICSLNTATCALFGYRRDELLGKPLSFLIPEAVADHRYFHGVAARTSQSSSTRIVFATKKGGAIRIKIRVAFSFVVTDSSSLVCALIDLVEERCFEFEMTRAGLMRYAHGSCLLVSGYTSKQLEGTDISVLLPSVLDRSKANPGLLADHMQLVELRHRLGHIVPVSVVVDSREETSSVRVTEIDYVTEASVTVNSSLDIVSVCSNSSSFFGFEEKELIGMRVTRLAVGVFSTLGRQFVTCQHKDGSFFFASIESTTLSVGGVECFHGTFRRAKQRRLKRMQSVALRYEEESASSDVLDGYFLTKSVLGKGLMGSVNVAIHRLTGNRVAVKVVRQKQCEEVGLPFPPREVDLLCRLDHPNIARFYHSISTETAVYVISEVVGGGELFDYVSQRDRLPEDECREFMRQIVSAVDHMHKHGVCHRDLKLDNILLDSNGRVKIIDFGLGNFFDAKSSDCLMTTFCGTPDYAPPECWLRKPYRGPELDIWCLGIILFIMATGYIPFNTSQHIVDNLYSWPPQVDFSAELRDLVFRILRPAELRCDLQQVISHPWLNDNGRLKCVNNILAEDSLIQEHVIRRMVEMGLPRQDSVDAVRLHDFNQLSTTYKLLESQVQYQHVEPDENSISDSLSQGQPLESPSVKLKSNCVIH